LWRRPDEEFLTNPFAMMRRFSEEMDRMFSSAWDDRDFGSRELAAWAPPVEVREREGNLVVNAELPGLNKEDVKVEVTNEGLVIQGERKREHVEDRGGIHRSERSYGAFYRLIPLPEGATLDKAAAEFTNGILEVSIPVAETKQKPREVPVYEGGKVKTAGG